jgi:hypothetical protein
VVIDDVELDTALDQMLDYTPDDVSFIERGDQGHDPWQK